MSARRSRLVPDPPSPLKPPRLMTLTANQDPLHRTYSPVLAATDFNPGRGRPTRFAPLKTVAGTVIPTLYAGQTVETAYFESALHDVPTKGADRVVPYSSLKEWDPASKAFKTGRQYAGLYATRDLTLAQLFAPDLKQWNIDRKKLIDTTSYHYRWTARWAEALHASLPHIDGLVWSSRQDDAHHAYVLFGDRLTQAELTVFDGPHEIVTHPVLFETLRRCAHAMGARIGEPDPPRGPA